MNAIVLDQPGELKRIIKDHPGKPAEGQVLLKVRRLGICGTDLHAYKGNQPFFSYPRILGHEIAAEAVEIGTGIDHVNVGDLCAILPYRNTVIDQAVKRGKTNCGSGLSVLGVHEDGAMQEYILCDGSLVIPANGLSLDQIAVIEPIAIGSHAIERAGVTPQDIVLIIGAGPIGIAAIMMGLLKSPRIVVMDSNRQRLEFVRQKYPGVDTLGLSDTIPEDLTRLLKGNLPTIVMDATGNKESMMKCFDYVSPGGTIVYVGLFLGDVVFYDPLFHRKEITLKSSRNALPEDFQKIIRLIRSGTLNIDGYVTHKLQFDTLTDDFTKFVSARRKM